MPAPHADRVRHVWAAHADLLINWKRSTSGERSSAVGLVLTPQGKRCVMLKSSQFRRWSGSGARQRPHVAKSAVKPPMSPSAFESLEGRRLLSGAGVVTHWNELLLQSLTAQPPRVPLSRNIALVHVAMFDAVNAIDGSFESYAADVKASSGASQEAAAAQAAHDTLVALYPGRQAIFDAALAEDLADIPPGLA